MTATEHWHEAYIGLGSNLDNPLRQLLRAVDEISATEDVERTALSPLYSSHPVGPQDQPDYINAVMRIKTRLSPLALLQKLQFIENRHGRERKERWGARTLDLDILLYDEQLIALPDLSVPHPEMHKRAFVLYPLADIAPANLPIPGKGVLIDLLATCPPDGLHRLPS